MNVYVKDFLSCLPLAIRKNRLTPSHLSPLTRSAAATRCATPNKSSPTPSSRSAKEARVSWNDQNMTGIDRLDIHKSRASSS